MADGFFIFQDLRFYLTTDFTDSTDVFESEFGSFATDGYEFHGVQGREILYCDLDYSITMSNGKRA